MVHFQIGFFACKLGGWGMKGLEKGWEMVGCGTVTADEWDKNLYWTQLDLFNFSGDNVEFFI